MKRIFIDKSKCEGCLNCSVACMQAHRADQGTVYDLDLQDQKNESRNFIVPDKDGRYVPLFCRHCEEPSCVAACMSGAMEKDEKTGHIQYDQEKCAACFMCVMNCPYGILKPDSITKAKVIKCDFCLEDNEQPNCVKACPMEAIYVKEVPV